MLHYYHISDGMVDKSVKSEDIPALLDSLKPAIEAITDPNAKAIITTLITIINVQQKEIEDLKEKLNINSNNSSKPPSTMPFHPKNKNKKKKSKRNRGGQPGHPGVTRSLVPINEVDHIEKHQPAEYCPCGGEIQMTDRYQRHQVHELPPIKIEVTEHQLFYGCCEDCKKEYVAPLPDSVPTGMLGPCLLALIATFGSDYKMSKRDVARLFMDLFQLTICIATVKRAEETVSAALKVPVEEAKAAIKEMAVVNCDETSHAECGNRMWTWVAVANMVAVLMIVKTRSAAAAKALLGAAFKGILGSDRYSSYSWVAANCRQICWAHLKRDFKKISERSGYSSVLGLQLLYYTRLIFHYWHKVRDGTMTREKFKTLMEPIRRKVEKLLMTGAVSETSKTKNTCLNILKIKQALWTFVDTVGVEPTNNIAERVLRQIVIWRKICFGTWSPNGTIYLERVMTVVATCRLQERSVFGFLYEAMRTHLEGKKPPSLLPNQAIINLEERDLAVAA